MPRWRVLFACRSPLRRDARRYGGCRYAADIGLRWQRGWQLAREEMMLPRVAATLIWRCHTRARCYAPLLRLFADISLAAMMLLLR